MGTICTFSGYSQGGLIARGILEQFPNHNVDTFISLSSPQAGQYGSMYDSKFNITCPDIEVLHCVT
jgi:alpha/beta superfamily hydrolase